MKPTADVDIVFEPVAQWQNFSGTNFLKLFFEDPKRWTGAFTQLNSLTRCARRFINYCTTSACGDELTPLKFEIRT